MPALDRLQESLGGPDFAVVPVSIDRGGIEAARKFYGEIGIRNLPILRRCLGPSGSRARRGRIADDADPRPRRTGSGRLVGPAEWDAPEIVEFLKPIIARQRDSIQSAERRDDQDQLGPLTRGARRLKTLLIK
jgi:hypothetical protein